MGMWCFPESYVVPATVVCRTEPNINCCEGGVPSVTGSWNVWSSEGGKVIVIQFVVDNMAVVDVAKASNSNDLHMMHLNQLLVFLTSKYNFWFTAMHVQGGLMWLQMLHPETLCVCFSCRLLRRTLSQL